MILLIKKIAKQILNTNKNRKLKVLLFFYKKTILLNLVKLFFPRKKNFESFSAMQSKLSESGSKLAKKLGLLSSRFQDSCMSHKVEKIMRKAKEKERSCEFLYIKLLIYSYFLRFQFFFFKPFIYPENH